MSHRPQADSSAGYESTAAEFMANRSEIGAGTVRNWLNTLPGGGAVLDLGCGHGVPILREIVEAGMVAFGIDASPSLVEACRDRFPQVEVECSPVETSDFFGRAFHGVIAWGLMFLLPAAAQGHLIQKVAGVLEPGGRFLFTSPEQACDWEDFLTGQASVSLGASAYRRLLSHAGLRLEEEMDDEGGNHYYAAVKES